MEPTGPTRPTSEVSLPWVQHPTRGLTHWCMLFAIGFSWLTGLFFLGLDVFTDDEGNGIGAGVAGLLMGVVVMLIGFGPGGTLGRQVKITAAGLEIGHAGWRVLPFYDAERDAPRLRLTGRTVLPADEIERFYHASSGHPIRVVPHRYGISPSHNANPIGRLRYFLTRESTDGIMIRQRGDFKRPWWFIHAEKPDDFLAALELCRRGGRAR